MKSMLDKCTEFTLTLLLTGLTFVSVTNALPSQVGNGQITRLSNNRTAVCPKGWILASPSNNDSTNRHKKMCVRIIEQILSWERARQQCRSSKGFLIKLDSVLMLPKVRLNDYLKMRGIDSLWTGMHHEHGTLLWDELEPHMVKAYQGEDQKYGWSKRRWKFDLESFKLGTGTCGMFQLRDKESSEQSDDSAIIRTKRSPSQHSEITGAGRSRVGGVKGQWSLADNDEASASRSVTDEKNGDSYQSILTSQRQEESLAENGGDAHNAGDPNPGGKNDVTRRSRPSDTARRSRKSSEGSTVSTTTRTDQSNAEDSDSTASVSKGSSPHPSTAVSTISTAAFFENTKTSMKNPENASLFFKTPPHTSASPQSSTSIEDFLNHIMEPSFRVTSASKISASIDAGPNEATSVPAFGTLEETNVSLAVLPVTQATDNHSNNVVSNMDMTSASLNTTTPFSTINYSNMTRPYLSGLLYTSLKSSAGESDASVTSFSSATAAILNRSHDYNSLQSSSSYHEHPFYNSSPDSLPTAPYKGSAGLALPWHNRNNSTEGTIETLNSGVNGHQSRVPNLADSPTPVLATSQFVTDRLRLNKSNPFPNKPGTSNIPTPAEDFQLKDFQNDNDQTQDSSITLKAVTNCTRSATNDTLLKIDNQLQDSIVPRIVSNPTRALMKNPLSNLLIATTSLFITTEDGSQCKYSQLRDVQNTDFQTLVSPTPETMTDRLKSFIGKILSKRSTATTYIPIATLTGVPTSTLDAAKPRTSSATTYIPIATSTGLLTSTLDAAKPRTSSASTYIPIATSTGLLTSTLDAAKPRTSSATTYIPIATSTGLPTSTLDAAKPRTSSATTYIPIATSTGLLTSTLDTAKPRTSSAETISFGSSTSLSFPQVFESSTFTTENIHSSTGRPSTNTKVDIPIPALTTTNLTDVTGSTKTNTSPFTIPTQTSTSGMKTSSLPTTFVTAADILTLTRITTRRGVDGSNKVAFDADGLKTTSATTTQQGITTTTDTIFQSRDEADIDSVSIRNASENSSNVDPDFHNISNGTRLDHRPASSNPLLITLAFPKATNSSNAHTGLHGIVAGQAGKPGGTSESISFGKEPVTKSIDRPDISHEHNNETKLLDSSESKEQDAFDALWDSSVNTEETTGHSQLVELSDSISLSHCQEEYASVCATEAVEELSLVGHCDRHWYGHRQLDRCYKPFEFTLKAIEARQSCLHHSASLATIDTYFYGNVTAMILTYFSPGTRVWVDASLNLDAHHDDLCTALEDGQLYSVDCNSRLPFICQKDAHDAFLQDLADKKRSMTFIQNLTSYHPQTLWCPLRMSAFDDVILWFKDGRPIVHNEDDVTALFTPANGRMPNRLDIDLSILERTGESATRIPKPAMLQGQYWCEIWRREPFNRVVSYKIYLKFTDVITLYGSIITKPINYVTAAIFNRMGHVSGLPAVMERRLAMINKNITHVIRGFVPIVRDIITFISSVNPITGTSQFTTYICIATGDMSSVLRGSLGDLYLSTLFKTLGQSEEELRTEWNLTLPIGLAVTVTMADMCPQANLMDRSTGLSATFPSTTVNNMAVSLDACNDVSTGSAFCKGDLQTGAFWDSWRVVHSCYNTPPLGQETGSGRSKSTTETSKMNGNPVTSTEKTFDKSSKSALEELSDVLVDADNIADVANRLANVLGQIADLSASDIKNVVEVVNRIVSVKKPPIQISGTLVSAANKVLDASVMELRKAEVQSNAPSRLLADLEIFGEKVNLGTDPRARFVTPNVAMELWNLQDASDVVIGFGAMQATSWASPLSEPRIETIKDRLWAEQKLSTFDIAIALPESLVKNTVRYSDSCLRLTMFIYRKTALFAQHEDQESFRGTVNSAIISASLGGRRIYGLEENVMLIFRPFQETRNRYTTTQCVFWDIVSPGKAKWSSSGCVYNGTINGRHVCLCNHLTNFAILTDFYGDGSTISPENETALTVLTFIGLVLSIIGLVLTILTFLAFKKLRQGRAQQTLFNMAIALLCFQTTFLVGVKKTSFKPVCLAVGVLLHYFILVSFAWMLIEAVLQYLTFVKVLGTYISRYTMKTVIPAWGVPLLPVIAVLATDYRLYLGRENYCWMNLQAFYYAFALPVGIILVFNIVVFIIIVVSLSTKPKGLRSNQSNNKTRKSGLKAALTIFVLLGLTWIFGYLAIEDARLPFQYAFTIFSSLQGFLIFLLMVARRRQVRAKWEVMCCAMWKSKENKQKRLSPTFPTSTTSSNSIPSFTNSTCAANSTTLSSSPTGLHRQTSLNI